MNVLRFITYHLCLILFITNLFFHAHAILGGEIPEWYFLNFIFIFPLYGLGFFFVYFDLQELRITNPVANTTDYAKTRPKILIAIVVISFLYGIGNFIVRVPSNSVKEENGKYYEKRRNADSIEISKEVYATQKANQDAFSSGHISVFLAIAMLFHFGKNRKESPEEKKKIDNKSQIEIQKADSDSRFSSSTPDYEYKGEDWNFWYRGVRSMPFWLFMITGFPFLIGGFFHPPLIFAGLFLSLILINVYILHRYHLVSIRANSEYVELEYYDFLTKHKKRIPRKDFFLVFVPKEIKMHVFYELIFLHNGTTLLKQSSENDPFTYKKAEEIFRRLQN